MTTLLIVDEEPLPRPAVRVILGRHPFAHRLERSVPDQDHDDSGRLHHLTGREGEVLARVASGRSDGEIADDLHLAEATVKSHVSSILAKIGAGTRDQAVAFAYEVGLVGTVTDRPWPA
ncbi:response regulator transcription factor [Streptomyces neyagawaensis]|uniref:response regulator transcription factor n=1 Tax=Streptomyces neyagawaensis TaxID=42238 RepID=UPI003F4D56FA